MPGPQVEVSVILPTFNRCNILRRALKLYGQQQDVQGRFEVIVVDDCSSDGTIALLNSAKAECNFPLKFAHMASNNGPSAARNKAVTMAEGSILLFSGDDILPSPRFVAEHYEWHSARFLEPNVGVLGHVRWAPELGVTPFMAWLERNGTQFAYGRMTHGESVDPGLVHGSNVSVKASFLRDSNVTFNEHMRFHEDSEWAMQLSRHGFEAKYNAHAIGDHLHPVNLDTSLARMRAVGRSLALLKSTSPDVFEQATLGLLSEPSTPFKKTALLLIDPLLGRTVYAPMARAIQKHLAVDKLFAACHASYMLDGLREQLSLSSQPSPDEKWKRT